MSETCTVKVLTIVGPEGPQGPAGPEGPTGSIPVYTRAADLPIDGSVLLAVYEPEVGEAALSQAPFTGQGFKRVLVMFVERTDGVTSFGMPAGWTWNT